MAVAVDNTSIVALNTEYTVESNAATSTVINTAEAFTITPTTADSRVVVRMSVADSHGAVTYALTGENWAGDTFAGSIAENTSEVIVFEGAKYATEAGKLVITFTPATGKRLLTDHALAVEVIEIL
jgi:hypothetical protein